MLGLAAVPSLLQGMGMLYMPESQRWLAQKKKDEQCVEVLKRVYKPESVDDQLVEL